MCILIEVITTNSSGARSMNISSDWLKLQIETELKAINDAVVLAFIRARLIEPHIVMRDWDYGVPTRQLPCWTVFEDCSRDLALVYCDEGFGPRTPWGMVWIGNSGRPTSLGMDTGWHPTFMDTFLDSLVATELPIWRVYHQNEDGKFEPITAPCEWDMTWESRSSLAAVSENARYWVLDSLRDPNEWLLRNP